MWYRWLKKFLLKIGFKEGFNDPLLFIMLQQHDIIYLFSYADDIVLTGSSETLVAKVITKLGQEFLVRELGDLTFFLGIQVHKIVEGLHLS